MVSAEVERVRRLIDGLRRGRRTHPQHGRREYSRQVREVAAACEALIETEPACVPALARRAVESVTTALMYLDDSSGVVGSDLHVLMMAVHARACAAAPPDPKWLASWLAKLRLDGPGWPDFELRDYAAALGQKGRAELARIVDERAKAAQPEFGRTPFGIRILREQLAEVTGDVDHYVAVLAEDLHSASQYLKIVDALRNAGRASDAEHWAQRGLDIGNPIDQAKLRNAYVELLLERGATEEALSVRRRHFDQHPTAPHYSDLRRTAEHTGDWGSLRDEALQRLHHATAQRPAFADHLVGVLLDEGNWTRRGEWRSTTPTTCPNPAGTNSSICANPRTPKTRSDRGSG
ncbi:DUF6880 family protein [Saccharopolyspora elongata]|uniref:Uncharacterized protein n=1 Tax=Saccharopolyspora elongata TaxID=2530387 RepID=A0A4R4Z630_9PSEU|nr:DUF6880 family protein [Saccharopolyspora elongata]TDD53356.1 hypothetical protein E1288_09590 [Saccharopolyspora elongata]